MIRSSVAVKALKMAAAIAVIVCAAGCGTTRPVASVERHVVPNRLVHVTLEDFDIVSFVDVDLHTAVQTREAVETEFNAGYGRQGHPRWFFHAFDRKNLDFVVARFEPAGLVDHEARAPEGRADSLSSRYVAQRRLRVKRSREAERALGVVDVVREYEVGIRGVRAGMTRREVTTTVGPPQSWIPRADKGSFDLLYPTFCVRFRGDHVEHVWRRDMCSY